MKLLSYCLVGVVATSVHYTLLILLSEGLNLLPASASAVGAFFGALVAYFANRRFTFPSHIAQVYTLPRFLLVACVGAALNCIAVWFGNSLLGLNYLIPQLGATLMVLLLTFEINRSWTFSV